MAQPTTADVMAQLAVVNAAAQSLMQTVFVLNQQVASMAPPAPAPPVITTSVDFSQPINSQFIPLT